MNSPVASDITIAKASKHLALDPVLKDLIIAFGPYPIRPHQDYYPQLVRSIIGQQLSVKAAGSINERFVALFGEAFPEPIAILEKTDDELRSVGLSGAKVKYVQDLAAHALAGKLDFAAFDVLSNDEVIAELTMVKGIGEWTAHMFLMWCMGRLDILPVGDLGIRTGIMKLYRLPHLPTPEQIHEIAAKNKWHPYESIASWYIWQSLDNAPK